MDQTADKSIQSTQTAFDIIEAVADSNRPSIADIAAEVDCSRSTVHYHLKTLQQNQYVVRDENGLRLGLRIARLGDLSLRKHRLSGIVETTADSLADETSAVAHVAVREADMLVWLYRSSDPTIDGLQTEVGKDTYLHCTAYGQAILASMTGNEVDDLVGETGLPPVTEQTITSRKELSDRLETVRELGFAYSADEFRDGVSSVAAPILDDANEVVGAIGLTDATEHISDPYKHAKARRFSDEISGQVRQAARIAGDHVADL